MFESDIIIVDSKFSTKYLTNIYDSNLKLSLSCKNIVLVYWWFKIND